MHKLFSHYNELLRLSIVAYHVTGKVKDVRASIHREVGEKLFESRLHHKMKLPKGWVHTVEYFLMLAHCRVGGEERAYSANIKRYYPLTISKKKTLIDERVVIEQEAIENINQQLPPIISSVVKSLVKPAVPSTSKKWRKS